jgi:PadR family transcriptional regulator, regulatory protein PadR
MSFPERITRALMQVLVVFIHAFEDGGELHGWAIKKSTGLTGAATYKMLDRLEDAGWITGRWEPSPEPGRPQRRIYQLTPNGERAARAIVAERRPEALRRTSTSGHVPKPSPTRNRLQKPLSGFFGRRSPGEAR